MPYIEFFSEIRKCLTFAATNTSNISTADGSPQALRVHAPAGSSADDRVMPDRGR
jgi:hypothetical protein